MRYRSRIAKAGYGFRDKHIFGKVCVPSLYKSFKQRNLPEGRKLRSGRKKNISPKNECKSMGKCEAFQLHPLWVTNLTLSDVPIQEHLKALDSNPLHPPTCQSLLCSLISPNCSACPAHGPAFGVMDSSGYPIRSILRGGASLV